MKKISIVFVVLFCILCVYIITLQSYKHITKCEFKKRIQKLHNLKIPSDVIRKRLSGVSIYYINLDKATDRRKGFDTFIRQHTIPNIQRIEGVYGKNVKDKTYTFSDGKKIQIKNEYPSYAYNMGESGCFLSHVIAMKTSYENGDEYALILEDDVDMNIVNVWNEGLMEVIRKAPKNWNIIQLVEDPGGVFADVFYTHIKKGVYVPRKTKSHLGTHAYIINRNAMFKFLESLNFLHTNTIDIKKYDYEFPIDFYLYNYFKNDSVYVTSSLFIVDNTLNSTQIAENKRLRQLFNQTADEKMISMSNHVLKSYL